ncbi:HAMP domain-containing sensor histidine kinase [Nocardia sp. CDC153]|uniref:sensor histidine kinase n=1 Tax=Nocardia sp. CDC153 TaxID=3112167 RepID=UPI002DBC6DE8|nr:HAMP domain-containing sensor histidine kinase [Nocardia sp. CDC153]MEC3958521.1 HAMP domain-containing sensor histidine kinase [Nocardia sp. CDC153]
MRMPLLLRSAWRTTRTRPTSPGQLRRTRWLLTALFTALTAVCLIVLGSIAASIDAHSRDKELDAGIDRVVTGLAREVYWNEDGSLDLETVRGDDDLSGGSNAVAVLVRDAQGSWQERFAHKRSELPADLVAPARQVAADEETRWRTGTDRDGHPTRLAGAPIWDTEGSPAAVIFAAGDPAPGQRDHRSLVMALWGGGLALVVLAGLAGHLLSGVSMRSALRMLDQQERFLSEASHELRTPLATLRLYLDAALRDPGDARRAVTDARSLTDRMGRMVAGLLARTRAETGVGELDLQRLHLDQLVEGVVAECGGEVAFVAEPTAVRADPDLLALAVRNLIDNALVHGGTPVQVRVAAGQVLVRDHGPGVDPELTDPFRRGAVGTRGQHGIGLSLVRWVADVHSGSVTLTSADGGGTLATLTLPEAPADSPNSE